MSLSVCIRKKRFSSDLDENRFFSFYLSVSAVIEALLCWMMFVLNAISDFVLFEYLIL